MKKQPISKKLNPDQLVLEFFDRVWHQPHDLNAIDELMTEDYSITTAGTLIKGRDAFKKWVQGFQKLLLEAKTESIDIFHNSDESKVVSRWVCSGKNNGIFGLKANQKFVTFTGIAIWSIRDNKLSACWAERSAYELYRHLVADGEDKRFV